MLPKSSRQMILSCGFIGAFAAFTIGLLFPPETPPLVHLIFLSLGGSLFAIGYWVWFDARYVNNIRTLVVADPADRTLFRDARTEDHTWRVNIPGLHSDDEVAVWAAIDLAKILLSHPNITLVILPYTDATCASAVLFAVKLATAWRFLQVYNRFQAWSIPDIDLQHRHYPA